MCDGEREPGTRGTILSWSPRKNQRRLRCAVKVRLIWLEGGTAAPPPAAGKTLNRSVWSKLLPGDSSFSPMVWLRQPAPIKIGVPQGRCLSTFARRTYLRLLDDRSYQLPQSANSASRTQPRPRGTLIADQRRACAARPKGKYSRERMALAPIRARRIFPATGHARSQLFRLPTSFNQLSRHNAAFFGTFLGSKKVPSSSFPLFPSSFRPILHKKALSLIACLSHFESALFHPCFFSQALTCRKSTWGYSAIARS